MEAKILWKRLNLKRMFKKSHISQTYTTSIVSYTLWLTFLKRHAPTLANQIAPVLIKRKGCELFLNEYLNNQANIRSGSLTCSYHFHVTCVHETPYPLLPLIICCYGWRSRSSSGHLRRWGRPDCSSSPTVAGFSLFYFAPAFLPICCRSFRQLVYFAFLPVVCFGLSLSRCLS